MQGMNMDMNRQMSFQWSYNCLFLFGEWKTTETDKGMYFVALGILFVLSILSQYIRTIKSKLEKTAVKMSHGNKLFNNFREFKTPTN